MPFYEYQCQSCGNKLEALQKMSDPPLTDCPACSKPELKKKISAAGFRLKGGGWYETDFKSTNKRNLAQSGDKPANKTESGDKSGTKKADSAKPVPAKKPAAGSNKD